MLRLVLSFPVLAVLAPAFIASPTAGQPIGSGPLSEISRGLSNDSRPVHERGRTVSEGSVGSMKSGPVRGGRRTSMISGPVSDVSVGPVTSGRPMTGGGSMTENSAGAVKHELDHSLGEQVYDLQQALGPLQERLQQQAAEDAAVLDAVEADEPIDDTLDPGIGQAESEPVPQDELPGEPSTLDNAAAREDAESVDLDTVDPGIEPTPASAPEVLE